MKSFFSKIFSSPLLVILLTVLLKIPMFFTKNIQEDSFITWRVAKNLMQYGVIGFNGEERISASTTHLYVFITSFFQLIFGENFIFPLLVFSGILFAIGSFLLAKILFPPGFIQGFFVILVNLSPPALTASCLGMEYGILFFLYNSLIYFGLFKNKKWAYFLFPILLLWTRIDTVIFLGIFFWADFYLNRKINFIYISGGILGLITVVGFNYMYFGEIINHTITAKKIAYKNLTENNTLEYFFFQWAYYGGLIKKFGITTFLLFLGYLLFLSYVFIQIFKKNVVQKPAAKVILVFIAIFALTKITLFSLFKAYFDWYYWLPRVFLFVVTIYYFLKISTLRRSTVYIGLILFFSGLFAFQWVQSYTIGYMEERQRFTIAEEISKYNVGISQSILLEPAGIIPFYTGLYTYDEVGLVNKKITDEMQKDPQFWWSNSVQRFQPDYILTIAKKAGEIGSSYFMKAEDLKKFNQNYELVNTYPISRIHNGAPKILQFVYHIRPIGKDYFLYKKRSNNLDTND